MNKLQLTTNTASLTTNKPRICQKWLRMGRHRPLELYQIRLTMIARGY